jgi:hypothetical protein
MLTLEKSSFTWILRKINRERYTMAVPYEGVLYQVDNLNLVTPEH